MACVIGGTLAIGWSSEISEVLRGHGCTVIAPPEPDPFSLLLHRARALHDTPDAVIVECAHDVSSGFSEIDSLLRDLAKALIPQNSRRTRVEIDAEPHEYFSKCISEAIRHDARPLGYLGGDLLKSLRAPPYIADTPLLFREFLRHGLSRGPPPLGTHLERPHWIWEDQNGRSNVWRQKDRHTNAAVYSENVP